MFWKSKAYICSHLVCHLDWQPCSNLISSPSCQCGYTWFNNVHESVMSVVNSTCILSSDVVVSINCILLRDFFDLNVVFVLVFRDPKGQKEIRYWSWYKMWNNNVIGYLRRHDGPLVRKRLTKHCKPVVRVILPFLGRKFAVLTVGNNIGVAIDVVNCSV